MLLCLGILDTFLLFRIIVCFQYCERLWTITMNGSSFVWNGALTVANVNALTEEGCPR